MPTVRQLIGLLALAAAVLAATPGRADAAPARRLVAPRAGAVLAPTDHPAAVRRQAVALDVAVLADLAAGRAGAAELPLFGHAARFDVRTVTTRGAGRYSLVGDLADVPGSSVVLAVEQDALAGWITVPSGPAAGEYRVATTADGTLVVEEIDEAQSPGCACGAAHDVAAPAPQADAPPAPAVAADDGTQIDLIVFYTNDALAGAGSDAAITASIQAGVDNANLAYQQSLVDTQISLVHVEHLDYDEGGNFTNELYRLTDTNDGHMDEVHALRDQHGADLVALIVENSTYCGIAWVMTNPSPFFDDNGFSVTSRVCAAGYTMAHEIGHNMGCAHDHDNAGPNDGAYSYSYGHRFTPAGSSQRRTVMAYAPGSRVPHFSNPDVLYLGEPTGIPEGQPEAADNARTIDMTRAIVAGFRASVPSNAAPGVGSVAAAPNPASTAETVTLTANGVSDADGTVTRVEFWRNAACTVSGGTLLGTDLNGANGWSIAVSGATLPSGQSTIVARAQDDDLAWSTAACTALSIIADGNVGEYVGDNGDDWTDPANWGQGTVPDETVDVTLPLCVSVSEAGAVARDVTVEPGGCLRVTGGLAARHVVVEDGGEVLLLGSSSLLEAESITVLGPDGLSWSRGTVRLTGGALTSASDVVLGCDGPALLDLGASGAVFAPALHLCTSAVLMGAGTIGGDLSCAGAIAPGTSPGLLEITGDLDLDPTATLVLELSGTAPGVTFDRIEVDGTAVIDGMLIAVVTGFTPDDEDAFEILAATTVDGRFHTVDATHVWDDRFLDATYFTPSVVLLPRPAVTSRVSLDAAGGQGTGLSRFGIVSSDGRTVAFHSTAEDLVPGDDNGRMDVFVADRETGAITRVSVSSTGEQGSSWSNRPSLSADGRFVAFKSQASNLVPDDTNGLLDVFVHDRDPDGDGVFDEGNGVTTRVSVASDGTEGNDLSGTWILAISGDGRHVGFESWATNLVPGLPDRKLRTFVHDRDPDGDGVFDEGNGVTTVASVSSSGALANDRASFNSISGDGRFITMHSPATNLVPGDANGVFDVFVHDRDPDADGIFDEGNGVTTRVTVSSAGVEADGWSNRSSLSADGRYVVYQSAAKNLDGADANGGYLDVYLHDRDPDADGLYDEGNGTTRRISLSSEGVQGDMPSGQPVISADGTAVAFRSDATNLVPNDTNGTMDVFHVDLTTDETRRVSVAFDRGQSNGASGEDAAMALSADGRLVAFESTATNLVVDDDNAFNDVFVHDLGTLESGDLTGDGQIDVDDLVVAVASWGLCADPPAPCVEDFDGDGDVDLVDLLVILSNWTGA